MLTKKTNKLFLFSFLTLIIYLIFKPKKNMNNISDHITFEEATYSNTAIQNNIDNIPDSISLENMKTLAIRVFEPLRKHFNKPILVTSFYRSLDVNKLINGSSSSQHLTGKAIDIKTSNKNHFTNKDIFNYIKNNLVFDQLIWEYGNDNEPQWVHVSYSKNSNRGQILQAKKINGKTKYIQL